MGQVILIITPTLSLLYYYLSISILSLPRAVFIAQATYQGRSEHPPGGTWTTPDKSIVPPAAGGIIHLSEPLQAPPAGGTGDLSGAVQAPPRGYLDHS